MLFLAIRHLMSRKRQTILIFMCISLASLVYVVISGMYLGMQEYVIDRLLNNTAHVKISARDQSIERGEMTQRFYGDSTSVNWLIPPSGKREEAHIMYPQGWFDRLRDNPDVRAYAPGLSINVIISRRDTKRAGTLGGIEPEKQVRVTALEEYMVEGSLLDLGGGGNKIILGTGLLERLGARVGEFIRVSSGTGEPRPFKIVGTLELGVPDVDNILMLASLRDVQTLNRTPGRINEISVALIDLGRAQELADSWKMFSHDNVESWIEANAGFMEIFTLQDVIRYTISVAILVVASFGIYNVLSIMVSQKRREIAILRSIGYSPNKILELFLIQGILLGIGGAITGIVVGYGVKRYVETIQFGGKHMAIDHLLMSYAPSIYITGFLLAFVSALVASILPARAASKLTPIDIIRSE
jgi:lipoprotein-releasing system permease protein